MTAGFEDDVFPQQPIQQQITKIAYVVEPTRSPDVQPNEESADQQVVRRQSVLKALKIENLSIEIRSTKSLTFVYLEQK